MNNDPINKYTQFMYLNIFKSFIKEIKFVVATVIILIVGLVIYLIIAVPTSIFLVVFEFSTMFFIWKYTLTYSMNRKIDIENTEIKLEILGRFWEYLEENDFVRGYSERDKEIIFSNFIEKF